MSSSQDEKLITAGETKGSRSIIDVQQDFAKNCGFRNDVIWDLLSCDQSDILKSKIKELIPDQEKGQNAIIALRETLFTNIWAQRKYTNRNSLSAIIYVLVTKEEDFNIAKESCEFSCHPVFRTRKCVDKSNSSACCMIFIDEVGRVYQNWKAYLDENVLPAGTMVVPKDGIYTFDIYEKVNLAVYATPANSTSSKVLNTADTTSAIGGFMAACIPIAALCSIPVAAPVLVVSATVGLTAAGYTAIRSGLNLKDRSNHEQSIGLNDRQARGSWLGVAGGLIGFGASGATRAMTTAAAAGQEISVVTELVVNGMNISSIVLSGTGVANGVLDMILKYQDNEDITYLDVVQLSASLVLFTHSVSNFRLASNIINETRNSTIQAYRDGLSNRQRRMFDKMSKETIRINGGNQGKIDIIRGVNDIPSKQYLNDLYKINGDLNKRNVRFAFGSKGQGVVLNNEIAVDTNTLRNNVQHNQGPDIIGQVRSPIPPTHSAGNDNHTSGRLAYTSNPVRSLQLEENAEQQTNPILSAGVRVLTTCTIIMGDKIYIKLNEFGNRLFETIINAESFENLIYTMAENFCEDVFRLIMNLVQIFVETMLDDLHTVLRTFISTESVLYRMLKHIMETYTDRSFEVLDKFTLEILEAVRSYFESLNPNSYGDLLKKCKDCVGYFAVTE